MKKKIATALGGLGGLLMAQPALAQEPQKAMGEAMQMAPTPALTAAQVLGLGVGVVLVLMLVTNKRSVGGSVGSSLTYLLLGVVFFTLAFGVSVVGPMLSLTMPTVMLTHMILMVVAMVMIVVSVNKVTSMARK